MSCMQATHDERKANYANKQVGMKLETTMQLQDGSGKVDYKLALIIFRTGEQQNGHFFVAAPTAASAWVIFNDNRVTMPMSLSALRTQHGRAVHGLMYVKVTAPADVDWGCLNPSTHFGANAPRQVLPPPPLPSPPQAVVTLSPLLYRAAHNELECTHNAHKLSCIAATC